MKRTLLIFLLTIFFASTAFCQTDTTKTYGYGKWGIGAELGPCTGMYFLTGNSKDKLNEGWCYANVGLTVSCKKFHYMLQLGGVSGSLKEDLLYGQDWKKGNSFGSVNLQLGIGYELLNTRYFNIIPFVSGGMKAFNTGPVDSPARPTATHFMPSYSAGTAFDFKINFPVREKYRFPGYEYEVQYLYFRVLTGVYPAYFYDPLKVNGSLYFVNLSIGGYYKHRRENKNDDKRRAHPALMN